MEYKPLGECIHSVIDHRGLTPKKLGGDWTKTGHRAISAKNIKSGKLVQTESINMVTEAMYQRWMPEEIERGDVLITSEAPFGEVLFWDSDEKIVLSQRVFGLKPDQRVCNARYLYYWMQGPMFQHELRNRATGTTVIGLRQPELLKCAVALPPLETQYRIARLLGAIDDKISTNSQLNDYLGDLLESLFDHALAQGSQTGPLVDYVEILSGGTPKTKVSGYWEGGSIPFFGPGDASGSLYVMNTEKHITEFGLTNCNSDLYPIDTVFLTARGTVGKVAMAGTPMAMNQSCFAFRGKELPQSVVYQAVKRAVKSLKAKANGATFAAINTRDLKVEDLTIPLSDAVTAFEKQVGIIHRLIRNYENENIELATMRDALLPKLMSGEIDVSKVDITQQNNHLAAC